MAVNLFLLAYICYNGSQHVSRHFAKHDQLGKIITSISVHLTVQCISCFFPSVLC